MSKVHYLPVGLNYFYSFLTQPSQASRSVDEMCALEAHALHQPDVQIAQRCPVLPVHQVLALLAARQNGYGEEQRKADGHGCCVCRMNKLWFSRLVRISARRVDPCIESLWSHRPV